MTPGLMEPASIGKLTLNNRLVMLATHLGYCEDGEVTQKLIDFYVERARHRPGLIIVGGCYTEHLGMSLPSMIGISEDRHIEGLSRLVSAVHEFEVPIAAQLYHAGRYAHSLVIGEQAVSASAVPCRLTRETPRALTLDEIHQTIQNFGKAAARAKQAGFDAVEIIGSAGYLINQFLAPCTNKRNDEYGGSLENRARFPLEVIRTVRKAIGSDFPILYRMSGEDFVENGLTLEDNKKLAPMFEEAGVDCFNVTGGWHEARVPQITMDVPRGHYAYLAEGIASVVGVPVIACNRINSPTIAQKILDRGLVTFVGMSRGFIADPEIVRKIREGRQQEIRTCIGCNQGCLDRVFSLGAVTCAINPLAGYEGERKIGSPSRGKIAVVGGGAAGFEVARTLSLRGFDVTLFEKQSRLGGGLRLAARVPGRGEFATYITYMQRELQRLKVEQKLGVEATPDLLLEESFDHVVCATGSLPVLPAIDGVENPHVITAIESIENGIASPRRVVVIGGMSLGCYAALYAASHGASVCIVEKGNAIGMGLGRSTRWVIMKNLRERGVEMKQNITVTQILPEYVAIEESGETMLLRADVVVIATQPEPDRRLAEELQKENIPVSLVGAAGHSGDLLETVHSAFCFASRFEL